MHRQRHIRPGRLLAAVVAVLAVGVMGAGLAWACTPDAVLDELSAIAGPPGTNVKVSGGNFPVKLGSRAEVRLDSTAQGPISVDGPLLGCAGKCPEESPVTVALNHRGARKASFSGMEIKIPDSRPGVYRIVAVGYDHEGFRKDDGEAWRTFEITKPATGQDPAPGDNGGRGSDPAGGDSAPGEGTTRSTGGDPIREAPGPRNGGNPATPRTATSNRPATGGSASRGTAPASRAGAPSPNGGVRGESPGDPGLVTAPSGQSLFKDSMPPAALTDPRRFGQPSGRSASGDLWSGFGSGRTPSLEPRRGDPPAEEDEGSGIGLAAGTGFLGLGLAALFASFLVAEVRRRRKAVRA